MATRDLFDRQFDEDVPSETTSDCPECGGRVRTNAIETTCEDCGLVIAETPIDTGPEWRSFEGESTSKRTGAPITPTRQDRGISSEIGRYIDVRGNVLSCNKRSQLGRWRHS